MSDEQPVSGGDVLFIAVILLAISLGIFIFVCDLRVRTGHLETKVRALEARPHRAEPKPSCKVNGQTVICRIPGN